MPLCLGFIAANAASGEAARMAARARRARQLVGKEILRWYQWILLLVQRVHVGDIISYTVACEPRIYFKLFYNCCTRNLVCALLAVLYVVYNGS